MYNTIALTLTSQIAWPLIANFSCASAAHCSRASNQGWRYFMYTMGGLMLILFALRFFVFNLYESPKYLMGRGRDAEAVEVVHRVARYNGTVSGLTVEMLREAEAEALAAATGDSSDAGKTAEKGGPDEGEGNRAAMDTSARGAVARKLRAFSGEHVKSLFATRKLAYSTSLLIILRGGCLRSWPSGWQFLTFGFRPCSHSVHRACVPSVRPLVVLLLEPNITFPTDTTAL